jgi:hypothetical protein
MTVLLAALLLTGQAAPRALPLTEANLQGAWRFSKHLDVQIFEFRSRGRLRLFVGGAPAETISGRYRIVDGSTIEISRRDYRELLKVTLTKKWLEMKQKDNPRNIRRYFRYKLRG